MARHSEADAGPVEDSTQDEGFGTLFADMHQELGAFTTSAADAADPSAVAVITDFDSKRDALIIEAATEAVDALRPDTITIKPSGNDALVLWDGHPVMQVTDGALSVTPEAIRVIAVDGGV